MDIRLATPLPASRTSRRVFLLDIAAIVVAVPDSLKGIRLTALPQKAGLSPWDYIEPPNFGPCGPLTLAVLHKLPSDTRGRLPTSLGLTLGTRAPAIFSMLFL